MDNQDAAAEAQAGRPAQGWSAPLLKLSGIVAVVSALPTAVLCWACKTASGLEVLAPMLAFGAGYLAAALLWVAAGAKWRRQIPAILRGLPMVLLAALLAIVIGASAAHQTWRRQGRMPDGGVIALLVIPWALLAGASSLWVVLSVEPHWLAVDAIQAAAGASALTYFSSFFHTFSPLSLAITYACGCPLGLLFWSVAWDIARPLLPATLQQYTQSWVEGGLVADGLDGLESLPANMRDVIQVAIVLAAFELWAFNQAVTIGL